MTRGSPATRPSRAARGLRRGALVLAVLLGLGAAATRLAGRAAEREHPPLGRTVIVDGWRQHVLERGAGPPVVFVHGAFGGLQDFAVTILDEASARYRCVLWDRPGHGYSERPSGALDPGDQARLLLALVRALELERPLLVGFSYGGAVCLAAALAAPDELRGVVLLNGPSHPWPDPLDLEYRVAAVPLVGWLVSECFVAPLGAWLARDAVERAFAPAGVPARFERSPLPLALRPASYRANTEDVRLLKPFLRAQAERYGELRVPVTALVASEDRVVSPTIHVPRLAEQAADCRVIRLEGAGHQILYTHPERVLAAIAEALGD